jgi:hypothetical protein
MPDGRRAFVLLAVLVVIGGATLVATMLVHFAGSENAVAVASAERARSRALAFSGIQVILSELDGERDQILGGRPAGLDAQYVLYEGDLEMDVVRLLPPDSSGELIRPLGGLLDLNLVSAADLTGTGLLDDASANAIIAARERRPDRRFRTLEDLLEVVLPDGTPAVTPVQLMGPLESFEPSREVLDVELDRGERALEALGELGEPTLREVLTVHSFEPALQRDGALRINLNVPFSETLGRRMDDRFGEGTGDQLRRLMERVTFDDDKRIVDVLRFLDSPLEDWIEILDVLTSDQRWHMGRIDLNTAPVRVLQTLEGIDPETAEAIVAERGSLTSEELATRVWPVLRELVDPETFGLIAGRVSTRCWVWSVRLAAGTVSTEDPDGPIRSPVIIDLVVDLAAPVPRIAALRDISGLEVGVRLYEQRAGDIEGTKSPDDAGPAGLDPGEIVPADGFLGGESGFIDDFESAFDDESGFSDPTSAFDGESGFSDRESVFDGPESDPVSPTGPVTPPAGPTGRWSPG